MNNQEIFELMAHFDASTAARLKLTMGEFSLELEKAVAAPIPAAAGTAVSGAAAIPVAPAPVQEAEPEGLYITAPLVGTFYAAPAPGAEPFVKVGDAVKRGQTVCLLEAMMMMSEVKAPCDCVIEAILPQDGALVSYGDALVRYREG